MDRIEWPNLLLKLVHALKPLVEPPVSNSSFLNQRFFIPPPATHEDFPTLSSRQPRLLKILQSVQKEVEEFIGENSVETPSVPLNSPVEEAQNQPLSKQAQKLIEQVQDAIKNLSSSTQIKNPEEAPLRATLTHLKPSLDQIIHRVTHEGMHSGGDNPPPPFRFSVPSSPRDPLIKKFISFPQRDAEPAAAPKKSVEAPVERRAVKIAAAPPSREETVEKRASPQEATTAEKAREPQIAPLSGSPFILKEKPKEKQSSLSHGENEKRVPPPVERTTLPGAPFTPETRSLTPLRKKKKRKGFWFREEEDQRAP